MSSLLPIFKWFDDSWVGKGISATNWLFPAIEAVHIVALALLCGAILILNLRLLGLTLPRKPIRQLSIELGPWVLSSLIIILATGLMLFASEAMKAYFSNPFRVKMVLLFAAIAFHYTIYGKVTHASESQIRPVWNKVAAAVSLILWFGVGFAGRGIGFL
jgi:hypothetical protein